MWVGQSVFLPSLPLSVLCMCECVSGCTCVSARAISFFFSFLQVVIHYSVSSFPWCLTATGTLCLEKMTSSSGRQYYLIPLFHSDCLALLWSPIRAFTVDCIVSISVCLSTFGSLVLLVFSIHDSFFFSSAVSLFFLLSLSLSALKILCVFLSQMLGW